MNDAKKSSFRVQFNRRTKYITFQMAEVAILRKMFQTTLKQVERLRLAPDTE